MIDHMVMLLCQAVAEVIRLSILKIGQVIKFSMVCLLNMGMVGAEQIKYFLNLAAVPSGSVDQFLQKGMICTALVNVCISHRGKQDTETAVVLRNADFTVPVLYSVTEGRQSSFHPGDIMICAEKPVQGQEGIVDPYLFLPVSQF